jgi:WG containing repeat
MNSNQSKILILITIFNIGCTSVKRISSPTDRIDAYPIGINGLWGYANENGDLLIDCQFEEAKMFVSGLAGVKKNDKYGFINRLGEFEIQPKYDSVDFFRTNASLVYQNAESYWINRKGKKLKEKYSIEFGSCTIPIEATDVTSYFYEFNGKFILKESELKQLQRMEPTSNYEAIDFTFDEVIPFSSKSLIVRKGDKFGIYVHYNRVGLKEIWANEIIPNYVHWNNDGKLYEANEARFRIADKWGILDGFGHIVLEPKFLSIKKSDGVFYLVEYKQDHFGYMRLGKKYFKHE